MIIHLRTIIHLVLSLYLMFPLLSFASTPSYNQIVFFGDSLTDNGNLYSYDFGFLPKSPPYFQGRFSNGYVWAEQLAKSFYEQGNIPAANYAVGGETAILHDPLSGFLPYTLTISLENYLTRNVFYDKSKTLFIFWIGANDYLKGSDDPTALTTSVVDSIKVTIEHLIYHGAANILVIDLPDIGKTPYGKITDRAPVLSVLTLLHNSKLEDTVKELKNSYKNININFFNISHLFQRLLEDTDGFNQRHGTHITETQKGCWGGGYSISGSFKRINANAIQQKLDAHLSKRSFASANMNGNHFDTVGFAQHVAMSPALAEAYTVKEAADEGDEPCDKPDEYVFWDRLHPTALMHVMLSKRIATFINDNYTKAEVEQTPGHQQDQQPDENPFFLTKH